MAMRSLAPQIKAIQERYAGDQVTVCPFFEIRLLLKMNEANDEALMHEVIVIE